MRSRPFRSTSVTTPGGAGDVVAVSMPAGETRGVIIDNPSGSWLLASMIGSEFVPPYTLGWSRGLPYGVASVTIRYVDGPAGQISTQQGDPFTVWLDSEVVGSSDGSPQPGLPFVEQFTPVLGFDLTSLEVRDTLPDLSAAIVAGTTGKRIRLLTLTMYKVMDSVILGSFKTADIPVVAYTSPNPVPPSGGYPRHWASLTVENPTSAQSFPAGVDYPIGAGIDLKGRSAWAARTNIGAAITYQLI